MADQVDRFYGNWHDKLVPSRGGITGQCVSLVQKYLEEQFNAPGTPVFPVQYAKQMFGQRNDLGAWVANTPAGIPPRGAIMVLDGRYGGGAGHTGVVVDANQNTYRLFQQNDPYGSGAHVTEYNYNGCVGWQIPNNLAPKPTPQPQADNEGIVQGDGLRGHTEPNTTSPYPWYFDDQEKITLIAKTKGENVQGKWGWTDWWYLAKGRDKTEAPEVWVSDGFVLTTKDPANVPDYVPPVQPPKPTHSQRPNVGQMWGVDVSAHQGDIDWAKVPVDFAIIKAGHTGKSYGGNGINADPKYDQNVRNCKRPYASYWYGYPGLNAKEEASAFAKTAKTGPLFLDLEEREDNAAQWATDFINEVERLTGRPCHLYTYYDYYKSYPGLKDVFTGTNRVLWLAHYGKKPGEALGVTPKPVIHQYTSSGALEGIAGNVDLNISTLTDIQFEELGKTLHDIPVPPPTPQNPPDPNSPKLDTNFIIDVIQKVISFLKRLIGGK